MREQKEILRQEAIKHRERMDLRGEDPQTASDLFFEKISPQPNQIVAAYWPKGSEFDTTALLHDALEKGYQCALPVVQESSRELLFVRWDDSISLKKGKYGIMEPSDQSQEQMIVPDIVVVPMLAFDRRGYRLGYGGGYYDTTLAAIKAQKSVVSVGLAYSQQAVLFNLPAEDHDISLDYVVTPQGVHCYKS